MLIFADGWEADNTSTPKMSKEEIEKKTIDALKSLVTTDQEFRYLKNITLNTTSRLARTKVTKGLHQEEGNSIIPDSHITLQIPDLPNPKTFHLYFWYVQKKTGKGWYPYKLTHIEGNVRKSVELH